MAEDDQKQGSTSQERLDRPPKAADQDAKGQEVAEKIQEKIRKIWKRIRKSPTSYGFVLYSWACLIGMLHAHSYYQPFGVNIFDFAEPFDFLLIAISKASIVLGIGLSIGIIVLACLIILISLFVLRFLIYMPRDIENFIIWTLKSFKNYVYFVIRILISLLHSAWTAFIVSVRAAWETYATLRRTVWRTYIASVRAAWKTYTTSFRAAWETYATSVRAAWKDLGESQETISTKLKELHKRNEESRKEARKSFVAFLRRFFYIPIATAFIFATLLMPSYRGEQDARVLVASLKSKQVDQISMPSWIRDNTSHIYSAYIRDFPLMVRVLGEQGNQHEAQHVRVALRQDSVQPGTRLPKPDRTLFLGTTSSFHFFYECGDTLNSGADSKGQNSLKIPAAQHQKVALGCEKGRPFIVPTANIASLEFNPNKSEVKPRDGLSDVTDAITKLDTTIRNLKFNAIFRMESGDVIFDTTKIAEAVTTLDETVRNFKPPVTPDPAQIVDAIEKNTTKITRAIEGIYIPPEVQNHCGLGWERVAIIRPFCEGRYDKMEEGDKECTEENAKESPSELVIPEQVILARHSLFEAGTPQQLMLIGRVDITQLNEQKRELYGSNNGLAQARAKWVWDKLVEKLNKPEKDALRERTILLSAGPLHVGKKVPEDRSVEVWVCGGAET